MHSALELLGFPELTSCAKGLVNISIGLGLIRGVRSFGSHTFRDLRSALIVKESLFALEDKSSPPRYCVRSYSPTQSKLY